MGKQITHRERVTAAPAAVLESVNRDWWEILVPKNKFFISWQIKNYRISEKSSKKK